MLSKEHAMTSRFPSLREIEVLRAYAKVGKCEAVAASLFIDVVTVRAHIANLREISGLHTLPQLVAWAYDNDWWREREREVKFSTIVLFTSLARRDRIAVTRTWEAMVTF